MEPLKVKTVEDVFTESGLVGEEKTLVLSIPEIKAAWDAFSQEPADAPVGLKAAEVIEKLMPVTKGTADHPWLSIVVATAMVINGEADIDELVAVARELMRVRESMMRVAGIIANSNAKRRQPPGNVIGGGDFNPQGLH